MRESGKHTRQGGRGGYGVLAGKWLKIPKKTGINVDRGCVGGKCVRIQREGEPATVVLLVYSLEMDGLYSKYRSLPPAVSKTPYK